MNTPLYEITSEFNEAIERYVSATSDEELLELEKQLTSLDVQFKEKVVAVSRFIRNLEGHESAIKAELERLNAAKKRTEQQVKWLKNYILANMERTNTEKIDSPIFRISIRKNPPSVIVEDQDKVPAEFKRVVTTIEVNKELILELYKKGVGVDGTKVEQKKRLSIA